jgi:hypothetical protein
MSQLTDQELNATIREVLKRAVADPNLRQLAVRDGKAAIAKVTDKTLAPGLSIRFVDNYGKSNKTVVIPDPVGHPEQLTEEELEAVAGGCGASNCGVTSELT